MKYFSFLEEELKNKDHELNEFNGARKALMWTDGRYYLQATKQLNDGWEMMKMEPGQI